MAETEIHTSVNFKSKLWQHYGFYKRDNGQLDKTNAICKLCHAAVKYTGSTNNLITHLRRRHGVNIVEAYASASAAPRASRSDSSWASGPRSGEQSVLTFFNAPLANS